MSFAAVVGVSLLSQAIYLYQAAFNDPSFFVPVVDAQVYHDAAVQFAAGGELADGPFWQPPIFPFMLGLLYAIVGSEVLLARIVLALMAVGSCVLVWRLGAQAYDNTSGVVAGIMLALYGPFLFFSTQLLPVGLAIFLNLTAITLFFTAMKRGAWWLWFATGSVMGLATANVPNAFVILLIVVGYWMRQFRLRIARIPVMRNVIVCAIGGMIVILPITIENYRESGTFIPLSTNGGINFYIGNNANADETVVVRPGEPWRALAREARFAGAKTPKAQSVYFFNKSLKFIRDEPIAFVEHLGVKASRILMGKEIPRNTDVYVHAEYTPWLSWLTWRGSGLGFPFSFVFPLAVCGFLFVRGNTLNDESRRARVVLLAFVLLYGLFVVMFFVASRHRLPAVVVLVIPAAAILVAVARFLARVIFHRRLLEKGDQPQRPASPLVCAMACVVFLAAVYLTIKPTSIPAENVDFKRELLAFVAHEHLQNGELERAKELWDVMGSGSSEDAFDWGLRAQIARLEGDWEAASAHARRAVELAPGGAEYQRLLGQLLHEGGEVDEAIEHLALAVELDPFSSKNHLALAQAFDVAGKHEPALRSYDEAAKIAKLPAVSMVRYAELLAMHERFSEAIDRYERALIAYDDPPDEVLNCLAWLLATCPDTSQRDCVRAVELARFVCDRTAYANPAGLDTLAAAYAECGRFNDAVITVNKAIEVANEQGKGEMLPMLQHRLSIYQLRLNH